MVLDVVIRALLVGAQHPDIAEITRYGRDQSIDVTYQDLARAYIWPVADDVATRPVDLGDLGPYKARTRHMLKLIVDLLDVAEPDGWQWRTVAVEGVPLEPCGLEVRAGSAVTLLRVTAGGSLVPEEKQSDPATWVGWALPADLTVSA